MEYARHVCGLTGAGHAEYGTEDPAALIAPVACQAAEAGAPRLAGRMRVWLEPGSLALRLYGTDRVEETFTCSYELNAAYRPVLEAGGLRFTGRGANGEARIAELPGHRFFLATLFLPQLGSAPEAPHPLVAGYLRAALERGGDA